MFALLRTSFLRTVRYAHTAHVDHVPPPVKINSNKLAVIGAGKMAEAIIGGMLKSHILTPAQIIVSDVNRERLGHLKHTFHIQVAKDNVSAIRDADLVLIAVKPQTMPHLMPVVFNRFASNALIISIVAGYSIHDIADGTGVKSVVRSMPNTPATIGKSMTVWTSNGGVSEAQKEETRRVLSSFGSELWVADEGYLDMATALSGTGPAYFFMIMEAMIDAGVHIGFPREMAKQLVLKTIEGSAQLALSSQSHPAHLRNDITSPGGTSAAALYAAERGGLRTVISDSVWAAYRLEMGGKNSCVGPGRYLQQGMTLDPIQVEKMLQAAVAGATRNNNHHHHRS